MNMEPFHRLEDDSQPDVTTLLADAVKLLDDIKSDRQKRDLERAKTDLNNQLFTYFNLGQRLDKSSREIIPCSAASRLFKGLDILGVPLSHQVRIIEELNQGIKGTYERATRNPFVPENAMQAAVKMWIYSTVGFAAIDKAAGRLKE